MSLHNNFRFAWLPRKHLQKWIQAEESEPLCFGNQFQPGDHFHLVTLFAFIDEGDGMALVELSDVKDELQFG